MPIDSHLTYIQKNAFLEPQIHEPPHPELEVVVVIPCHNEPDLIASLESLKRCDPIHGAVEVITVVNSAVQHPDSVREQNEKTLKAGREWAEVNNSERLKFHFIHVADLPKKHAGVGLARKIGMDEAVRRFEYLERDGIIDCFDADSDCDPNKLTELVKYFDRHPKIEAVSTHFEHPLEGDFTPEIYAGIIRYELYLRYFTLALRYAGHPHAFHTIGSSMAVRASGYQRQGGMNRRKAGEDFYFLHKFIQLGTLGELKSTRILPSPRSSDRVPFGTGKAISAWLENRNDDYPVFAFDGFVDLKAFLAGIGDLFEGEENRFEHYLNKFSGPLKAHFEQVGFVEKASEARHYTTTADAFVKRFYRWFDGLKALQFFHFLQENGREDEPVRIAAGNLLQVIAPEKYEGEMSERRMLEVFREIEKAH